MTPLLQADALTFRHGLRTVLHEISLTAGPGEFLAILGMNGAGKSTLLDLLAGIREPASGQIWLTGHSLPSWSPRDLARELAHLPQSVLAATLPFTARELVAMGRYPHAVQWTESPADRDAVAEAMNRTGCFPWQDRPLQTLSGGERQRVLLAAILAHEARVLLLDEPATYLDIAQQLACYTLLREEAERGRLCLAVTHDLNLALRFCTRLLILAEGRVAHDLSVPQALADPGWLALFSPRLHLHPGPEPWVAYR